MATGLKRRLQEVVVGVQGLGQSGGGGGGGRWWKDEVGPLWAPQRCDTQAIVPAYRLGVVGSGLRGHSVQRPLITAVLT